MLNPRSIDDIRKSLQKCAEKLSEAELDSAAYAAFAAARIARVDTAKARVEFDRRYYCMHCKGKTHGDAPEEGCPDAAMHMRPDGSRYAEPPPPDVITAMTTFHDEHFGLPWYLRCAVDDDGLRVVVVTRRPNAPVPEKWLGHPVVQRRG